VIKVYVAGPYTKGDPCINTNQAIHIGQELLNMGYSPFLPHLSHFWHTMIPNPWETWMALDLDWLPTCDVLFRFGGESRGADIEEAKAKELGIPIVRSYEELERWRTEGIQNAE